MGRLFYALGAVFLAIIVLVGAGVGVLAYRGNALDKEAKAFVDAAVPAIAAQWNEDALLERSAPELRAATKPAAMSAVFQRFAQFGPLVKYAGSTGQALMAYNLGKGGETTASFIARAKCQNGEAIFRMTLVKRSGRWEILNLHIDPASPVTQSGPRGA